MRCLEAWVSFSLSFLAFFWSDHALPPHKSLISLLDGQPHGGTAEDEDFKETATKTKETTRQHAMPQAVAKQLNITEHSQTTWWA